jgi:hypothetical protein
MPNTYIEGSITYMVPEYCVVFRPEESTFYSRHWQSFAVEHGGDGNAEIDFVIFDNQTKCLWLVEAKDYRAHGRTKPSEIGQEFARKCRDTLSLLGALQVSSQVSSDYDTESRQHFSKMCQIRCVLHFEQSRGRRGEYSVISSQNLKDTIKRNLRTLDPHAKAGDASQLTDNRMPLTITL